MAFIENWLYIDYNSKQGLHAFLNSYIVNFTHFLFAPSHLLIIYRNYLLFPPPRI